MDSKLLPTINLKRFSTRIRDFLFPLPDRCCYCGGERDWTGFCANCWQEIYNLQKQEFCHTCGRIINNPGGCPECRTITYAFSMARGVGEFRGIVKDLLYQLKYVGKQSLAKPMGSLMADVVLSQPGFSGAHYLIPIPLARGKLEQRKFNQSRLLAEEIGRLVELPVVGEFLVRSRETGVQAKLGRAQRRYNMDGAFIVPSEVRDLLSNKKVIVVDDVFTTGSTVNAAASALRGAGAGEVTVITWATGVASFLSNNVSENEEDRHEHQKL